ncbi:MAG TPA: hypothetical protein VFF88_03375 [Methylocella sp.]|jgi:DNA repair exonuclease SbcCD ATPase subunit|nr:hypothetical protein [Methylocella sp.]
MLLDEKKTADGAATAAGDGPGENASPAQSLRAWFARLQTEYDQLCQQRQRIEKLNRAEAEILSELSELEAREREAMSQWAQTCTGSPPAPLMSEREALARRLAEARSMAAAAAGSVQEIEEKQRELAARMNEARTQLETEVLANFEAEGEALHEQIDAKATSLRAVLAEMGALRMWLSETGHARNREKPDSGQLFFRLCESLARGQPDWFPSNEEIDAAKSHWERRFRDAKGAPG